MRYSGKGFYLPVYREGNVISLPSATLEVLEACSGIRSLVSLTALATVYAYLAQRWLWTRLVLVVSAVPLAPHCPCLAHLGNRRPRPPVWRGDDFPLLQTYLPG
jgi:hypothetical protein